MHRFVLFLAAACLVLACAAPRVTVLEDPLTPKEHLSLGEAYEKRGELDLALREYEAAAKEIPLAHLFAGNAAFLKKDYPRAEKHYKEASHKMPRDPRPLNNLAWLYYTEKRNLDRAESLAKRAIELAGGDEKGECRDTLEKILRARAKSRKARP